MLSIKPVELYLFSSSCFLSKTKFPCCFIELVLLGVEVSSFLEVSASCSGVPTSGDACTGVFNLRLEALERCLISVSFVAYF